MSRFIIRFRWLIISVCLITGCFFIFLIPKASTEPDIRNYIPSNLQSKIRTDSIESVFGFQDMVMILYRDTSSVITGNNLTTLKRIEEQLSQLSEISSIISPFSIKAIRSEEGYMVAERLVGQIPSNRKEEEELISRINSNSYSRDIVFSPDLKTAAITLTLSNKTHETELLNKIDSVIISSGESNKVMKGGLPVIRKFILKDVRRDAIIVVPVALFIMLLILRLTLGSWRNVYIPFSVVILSTGISMGLIPLLGWKLSIITLLIPIILIAVANNYGIYLVSYYNRVANTIKGSKYEILKEVMGSLRIPVLFSGLTTIAGILGLLAHSIIPARQVGVLAACGISIALAMSFFMVPALLSVSKTDYSAKLRMNFVNHGMDGFFRRLSMLITKHPGKVLVFSVIVILSVGAGIIFLRTDTNQEHFFPERHPLRRTSEIINKSFGGSQTISVMISGNIKDPRVMKGIDLLTNRIESEKGVGKVFSISKAVREMSKALYDRDEEGYNRIPDSEEAIAQMFELYYMSGDAEDFKQLLNPENDRAHIIIRLSNPSGDVIKRIVNIVEETRKEIPAKITTGGYALIMYDFTGSLIKGQVFSLAFALIIVFILLSLVFRSVKGGLTGSIPLAASIIVLFGFMGYSGIAIDPATALLSSVMIGVGVDFTIQYMWRFNIELKKYKDYFKATEKSFESIGQSIVINAFAVMGGFGALIFSGFTSIKFFGYLVVISIASCLAGSLFVIPAFLIKFRPRFIEKNLSKIKYSEYEKEYAGKSVASVIVKDIGPAA